MPSWIRVNPVWVDPRGSHLAWASRTCSSDPGWHQGMPSSIRIGGGSARGDTAGRLDRVGRLSRGARRGMGVYPRVRVSLGSTRTPDFRRAMGHRPRPRLGWPWPALALPSAWALRLALAAVLGAFGCCSRRPWPRPWPRLEGALLRFTFCGKLVVLSLANERLGFQTTLRRWSSLGRRVV
jgi:hypothetical protein